MDFNRSGFSRVDFMRLSFARLDSYVAGFSFNWVFIRLAFQTAVFFFFYKAEIFTLLGFDKAKFCMFGFLYSWAFYRVWFFKDWVLKGMRFFVCLLFFLKLAFARCGFIWLPFKSLAF